MKWILSTSVLVAIGFCMLLNGLCFAQEQTPEIPDSFVLEDLQLISLAGKSEWENDWEWSRAVEAATILAWLHEHGYTELLDDLNDDGVIDEWDTIELADLLGIESMGCESVRDPTDPWLVIGLAQYVAGKYPDIFELKIYDPGFPTEFEQKTGQPFTENAISGIILTLKPEPSFAGYMQELVEGEGVILGLEEELGRNLYFAGRSFLRDPIAPNIYGIDLAWAEEDWYQPGIQGKIYEDRARQTDAFYVNYQGRWMTVESMFALSPLYPPGEGPAAACPDLVIAGSAVCECRDRECTITVYATVYNVGGGEVPGGFTVSLMGIDCDGWSTCPSHTTISGADVDQLNTTGSVDITFPAFTIPAPTWPCPTCTFVLAVDSHDTIDESCYPAPWGEFNNTFEGAVCCDDESGRCPDLTVSGVQTCRCVKTPTGHFCVVHIEATVGNSAPGVPVSSPFLVGLIYGCTDGSGPHPAGAAISGSRLAQLNTAGSTTVDFYYAFATPDPVPPCCEYVLIVDPVNSIYEACHPAPAGEHNNVSFAGFCCDTPPTTQGRCPDLTIFGEHTCTCRRTPHGDLVCTVGVDATVSKIGADVIAPFSIRLQYECEDGGGMQDKFAIVSPAEINPDNVETVHFDLEFTPTNPAFPCCAYDLFVDWGDAIDERCFAGGEMNNAFGPVDFCCDGTTQECPDLVVSGQAVCQCGPDPTGLLPVGGECTITVYATVTNAGPGPIGESFDVTLEYFCEDGSTGTLQHTVSPGSINPTGSTSFTFTYPFTPPDLDHNCCSFQLTADSGSDIEECPPAGEFNNVAGGAVCCPISEQECVDLTVSGRAYCICGRDLPNLASDTGYGCRVIIDVLVTKAGPGEVSIFTVALGDVLCNGTPRGGAVRPLTAAQLTELNTTGSTLIMSAFSWDIPWPPDEEPPCCSYTLTVDSGGVIPECPPGAEGNNIFADEFCCEGQLACVDLTVSGRAYCICGDLPNIASDTGYGCLVTVDDVVSKSGPGTVPHSFSIGLQDVVCNGGSFPGGNRSLTSTQLAELNATGSTTIPSAFSWSFGADPQADLPCCTYTLVVDSLSEISECPAGAEGNNIFAADFCCEEQVVSDCPDIEVDITRVRCSCKGGDPIYERQCTQPPVGGPEVCEDVLVGYTPVVCSLNVYFTISNTGGQATGPFHVCVETSDGDTDKKYVSNLAQDEEKYGQFNLSVGEDCPKTVTVTADCDGEVVECDEDNNTDDSPV